jgi:3',5'-cyclic AMP phosphodiesterase CpdA
MRRRGLFGAFALGAALAAMAGCGGESAVTFGVVADCQFAAAPAAGSRYYSHSWLKLREAVDLFNARNVRFVVHLGDLIDHDARSYDLILPVLERSKAPVRLVLGNHDLDIEPGLRAGLPGRLGTGRGYGAFSEGGWRFVVLNGDELGVNHPKDAALEEEAAELFGRLLAEGRPNATKWNGGVGRAQVSFLERELALADRKGTPVVVLCHFPVFPPAGHNLWNDEEVVSILAAHPSVKAYFCGHDHAGGYTLKDGVHYVTFAGMVETRAASAGAVVTLAKDRISIDGFGREPDRTLLLR